MGCSATRDKYTVFLVIGGNTPECHNDMLNKLESNNFTRIINLNDQEIKSEHSTSLESNPNYKQVKSSLQNRGILFALFVQHDFDGLIIYHESGAVEQYKDLLEIAAIQWDTDIANKICTLHTYNNQPSIFNTLKSKYNMFNFSE